MTYKGTIEKCLQPIWRNITYIKWVKFGSMEMRFRTEEKNEAVFLSTQLGWDSPRKDVPPG